MRKVIAILMCLGATSAFAQQAAPQNTFSIFVSNPGGGYSKTTGHEFTGGYGIAYERALTNHWSAVGSIARDTYDFVAVAPGSGSIYRLSSAAFPLDIAARYHFFTSGRWRSYGDAGLRYVRNPGDSTGYGARLTPEVGVGLAFQMTRQFSVFGQVTQGLRNRTGPAYDPLTKTSFGLRFSF